MTFLNENIVCMYRLALLSLSALKKHKLTGDTSVMTYRGHGVLHTLIRCRFSPEFSTGQRFIYSGCSTGKIISESAMCSRVILHHLTQSNSLWHHFYMKNQCSSDVLYMRVIKGT